MKLRPDQLVFDNELLLVGDTTIECPSRKAIILIDKLLNFIKIKDMIPMGEQVAVGIRGDTNEVCYAKQDEHFVHIGCLKEQTVTFQKKYVQLLKLISDGNNRNTGSEYGSAEEKEDKHQAVLEG